MYTYLKAIHIVFVVTWFAGLFYFPRLLVYDVEARENPPVERDILLKQFRIMQKRLLLGITWPSMILTLVIGIWLKLESPHIAWSDSWFVVKLSLVAGLIAYHISLHKFYSDLLRDKVYLSSGFLRLWNEVPTLFLIGIVFLVVLKSSLDMAWGLLGIAMLILLLTTAIRIYKKVRQNRQNP